jgi:hypothetical protein
MCSLGCDGDEQETLTYIICSVIELKKEALCISQSIYFWCFFAKTHVRALAAVQPAAH